MAPDPDNKQLSGDSGADRASTRFREDLVARLPNLRRFALTLCRSKTESDDLVQATCERALGRWQQFQPATRMESWLFAIMHSIWKNQLRSASNQRRAHGELAHAIDHTDGEREILGKIGLSEVLSALTEITIDQAAAITLVSLDGLSYAEAARVLGIPQGTLESRIARGRIALGRVLEGDTIMLEKQRYATQKSRGMP